ncbi:MAG: hypothetical protein KDN22_25005 [Verrucomicrobiae bacterium]|nr:hypothetical protein [Verrucomicrobiae bacterium]
MEYYEKTIVPNPDIDMVFLSLDFEEGDMINYLKEPKLTCPAVRFDALEGMKKSLGSIYNADEDGVPLYLVLDHKGTVLSRAIEHPSAEELTKLLTGPAAK